MKETNSPCPENPARRRLLGALTVGGGAVAAKALPERWTRPVVDSVLLPAHAQMSPAGGAGGGGGAGPRFTCRIQGSSTIPVGGMGTVLLTITPPPGAGVQIRVEGDCNGLPAIGGTQTINFDAAGQATIMFTVPGGACVPGNTLTLRLTAPGLGRISATCRFTVG